MDGVIVALQGLSVLIASTLFYVFVYVTALSTSNHPAMIGSIVAVGITYLSNSYQLMVPRNALHLPFFFFTIGAAIGAGILLLV